MLSVAIKYIVIFLSVINTGYMIIDGTRALLKGDYIRPETGEYAGRLGPWAGLVEKVGINPLSAFMKWFFVIYGLAGLVITLCFATGTCSWKALIIYNASSLWYLFMGTANSVLQIVLLIILRLIS